MAHTIRIKEAMQKYNLSKEDILTIIDETGLAIHAMVSEAAMPMKVAMVSKAAVQPIKAVVVFETTWKRCLDIDQNGVVEEELVQALERMRQSGQAIPLQQVQAIAVAKQEDVAPATTTRTTTSQNIKAQGDSRSETGTNTATLTPVQAGAEEQQKHIISRSLWEGKRPSVVRDSLRDAGYEDNVIARVLYEWCDQSDTHIGFLLHVPNADHPGRGKGDSACYRRSKALRQKASTFAITTD